MRWKVIDMGTWRVLMKKGRIENSMNSMLSFWKKCICDRSIWKNQQKWCVNSGHLWVVGSGVLLILLICILNFSTICMYCFYNKSLLLFKIKNKAIWFEITYNEVIDREENGPQDQALWERKKFVNQTTSWDWTLWCDQTTGGCQDWACSHLLLTLLRLLLLP